jgi:uncharacterized membrane protein HdeD (DUF308 family)
MPVPAMLRYTAVAFPVVSFDVVAGDHHLLGAIFEIITYVTRGHGGSRWLLISAIITFLVGGLIWFRWPCSSVWAIGTLVGVNLLMTGRSRLMLGMAARKSNDQVTA